MLSTLLLLALGGAVAAQEPKAAPAPAKIVVRLPADARLFVDDVPFPHTGPVRTFETPPLNPGENYHYTLRAELVRDGQPVRVSLKANLKAGQTTNVDFGDLKPAAAEPKHDKPPPADGKTFELTAEEKELFDLTNKERVKAGLKPLTPSPKLFRAARAHSANMAKHDKLDHVLDGKNPGDRLREIGYAYLTYGENCAAGQRTPAEALESWMQSTGHRANILNGQFTEVGLGVAANERGMRYWTQVFALPQ